MKGIFIIKLLICYFCFCSLAIAGEGGDGTSEKKSVKHSTVSVVSEKNTKEIKWLTIDEALRLHKVSPKKIFVDIYTDWCTACKKMDGSTFQHPTIVDYINEHFYPVKMDAEMKNTIVFNNKTYKFLPDEGINGLHELAIFLTRGRPSFPSIVFVEDMNNPQAVRGFLNPVRMEKISVFFAENFHKQQEWGVFERSYKSRINESTGRSPIEATIPTRSKNKKYSTTATATNKLKQGNTTEKKTPPVRKRRLKK